MVLSGVVSSSMWVRGVDIGAREFSSTDGSAGLLEDDPRIGVFLVAFHGWRVAWAV